MPAIHSPPSPFQHDVRFKKMIQADLRAFIRLFFPALEPKIDFSSLTWLDKEFFLDAANGAVRNSDLLARVSTFDATPLVFVFLIEVQDRESRRLKGSPMPDRLFRYYSLIWARYGIPIFPLVLYLFQARGGVRHQCYRHLLLGKEIVRLNFWSIGLPKLSASAYLDQGGAMAGALASLMHSGIWSVARHKAACLETIDQSDSSEALKYLAIDCVETYLELGELERLDDETLEKREDAMDYRKVTKIEKSWAEKLIEKGELRGEGKGEVKGKRSTLLRLLSRKFGALPEAVIQRLEATQSAEQLDDLADRILTATSLDEMALG